MAIVNISHLGELGIIEDEPSDTLPPEAFSAGQNVRFLDGKVQKIQGEQTVYDTPSVEPHFLLRWPASAEYRWIYAAPDKIYYTNGVTSTDVTRYTTTPGDNDYQGSARPIWTGRIFNGIPLVNVNSFADYPQEYDSALGRFKDLSNWPANTYCKVLRSFKSYLIALDVTESGTNYPDVMLWSDLAPVGGVPANWDYTDPTSLAGRHPFSSSYGKLVNSLPLGTVNMVYTEESIQQMQEVRGTSVFKIDPISETIGALGPYCVIEFYKKHLVVGQNDIVLFDGVRPSSIINRRMRKWFFANLNTDHFDKTVVLANYPNREVWICFPEVGAPSGYLTKALVWNWDRNAWTIKDLDDYAFATFGQVDTTLETFDSSSGSFDTDFGAFGSAKVTPAQVQLLFSKVYNGNLFLHGDDDYTVNGTNYTSYVERTGLAIAGKDFRGNPIVDPATRKFVRSLFPKIASTVPINFTITVGSQEHPQGGVTWGPPQTFVSGTDYKVDCEIEGRYLAYRIEETGNAPWELTGIALDMDVISRY